MYEYEYVPLEIGNNFTGAKIKTHKEIISEYVEKGYRFVGYIPTEISTMGIFKKVDLIFEKIKI